MNDSEKQNTSHGRKNREQKERDKVIIESRKEFFKCLLSDTEGHVDTARVIYTLCILTFTSPAASQQICTLFSNMLFSYRPYNSWYRSANHTDINCGS